MVFVLQRTASIHLKNNFSPCSLLNLLIVLIFLINVSACGGGGNDEDNSNIDNPILQINSFLVSNPNITAGESTTLSWDVDNATNIEILPDIGTVESSSSIVITPSVTTTYNLTASNEQESLEQSITVTVLEITAPPINKAQQVSFIDTDTSQAKIGGDIIIVKAVDESDISGYRIRWGNGDNCSLTGSDVIASLPATGDDIVFNLAQGTSIPEGAVSFIVNSYNNAGEMSDCDNVHVVIQDLQSEEDFLYSVCDTETIAYQVDERGLPQLQSHSQAPVALYLDFDGGTSLGKDVPVFDEDGDIDSYNTDEQADIVCSWKRTTEYFAVFDINITTQDSVRAASDAWAWIVVGGTDATAGGRASVGTFGRSENPISWVVGARARIGNSNKSRSVASELGHNFGLWHQGVYVEGEFVRLNVWQGFDGIRGAIMGSGDGIVNGWRYGQNDGSGGESDLQDDIAMIRTAIEAWTSSDGWRPDDFAENRDFDAVLLFEQSTGIIERPGDVDVFSIDLIASGDLTVTAKPRGVSTPDLVLSLFDDFDNILSGPVNLDSVGSETISMTNLSEGRYYIEISSTATDGPYNDNQDAILGAYKIDVLVDDR